VREVNIVLVEVGGNFVGYREIEPRTKGMRLGKVVVNKSLVSGKDHLLMLMVVEACWVIGPAVDPSKLNNPMEQGKAVMSSPSRSASEVSMYEWVAPGSRSAG
jgi:hypothetical protein